MQVTVIAANFAQESIQAFEPPAFVASLGTDPVEEAAAEPLAAAVGAEVEPPSFPEPPDFTEPQEQFLDFGEAPAGAVDPFERPAPARADEDFNEPAYLREGKRMPSFLQRRKNRR